MPISPHPSGRAPLEARFFPRAAVDLAAEFRGEELALGVRVENISVGGAFLRPTTAVPSTLAMGSVAALCVALPDGPLDVRGVVVWLRRDADAGIAVRFDGLGEAAAGRIQRLVEQLEPMAWEGGDADRALPRELAARFVPVLRRMAARLASSLPSSRTSADDLVGAGFLGLVEAYRRWPSRTLAGFEPYALVRMRGAMVDELRRADPLSRAQRQRARDIELANAKLWTGLGRQPDDDEVAALLGLELADYRACRLELASAQPLVLQEGIDAATTDAPDDHAMQREATGQVALALSALPERLRRVLQLYYGDELTLREVGNVLGVSESRISQLLSQAVAKLRDRIAPQG